MGQLLQAGGYEKYIETAGRMDEKPDTDADLETLEENKNPLYQSQKAGIGRRTGLDVGKHKKRLLANRP